MLLRKKGPSVGVERQFSWIKIRGHAKTSGHKGGRGSPRDEVLIWEGEWREGYSLEKFGQGDII